MIFLRKATQNDHFRLLYKFETEHFFFGCVGSCGYAPASVKWMVPNMFYCVPIAVNPIIYVLTIQMKKKYSATRSNKKKCGYHETWATGDHAAKDFKIITR